MDFNKCIFIHVTQEAEYCITTNLPQILSYLFTDILQIQ